MYPRHPIESSVGPEVADGASDKHTEKMMDKIGLLNKMMDTHNI